MQPASFFHVALKVSDLEASCAFYVERFDAEVLERGRAAEGEGATAVNHVALEVADKRVYLFDRAPYEAVGLVHDVPTGFLHFGYEVADVDAAWDALPESVARVMPPATFGGLRIAFLADPDGNRIELLEHLDDSG
jgi:catechol 2,3-dioxygenase-like lactoylglutathione lyase family enzyme